ncbi:MAG: helix-turn-helix transcriptional regulator [Bacteroidales bacterium]|nr:helix-turn-helix transcriptional regulator [Bacteroidales bacterium]
MKQLKNNIKALIKEKGKTQEEVASALGIKQNTLSEKIGKNERIKFQLISDIADILEIPIIDIITYPDKYVKEVKKCEKCEELSLQIKHLNEYIELLKKQIKD